MLWPAHYSPPSRARFTSEIARFVARDFGYDLDDLRGRVRNPTIVRARAVLVQVCRRRGMGLSATARLLNRDHTTISHSLELWPRYLEENPELGRLLSRAMLYAAGCHVPPLRVAVVPGAPATLSKRQRRRLAAAGRLDQDETEHNTSMRSGSLSLAVALRGAMAA